MDDNLKDRLDQRFEKKFGMTYDEFKKLDFEKQQRIIESNREKNKKDDNNESVIIGYGENSFVTDVEKGSKVVVRYGNVVEAGLTRKEARKRIENDLDDALYSKPVALVKKLTRNIRRTEN